ncbi:hypothetical protein [Motiliproteus sp. MSK22-1]|uniref:hypothetical protein n=1 Tax=Motiliproteus sp. MSK22-1 TaxID=1897630 RepID=UPI0009782110|nr:hypothetical protein [Motiliproteus sp. MSK22-1]OMH30083.1 hypothetical protein BGP75_19325 [Motiliproteus sp. MSK22-1]
MIPKPVYEAQPYAYVVTGLLLILEAPSLLLFVSALLLYSAGAIIWIVRAIYRGQYSRHSPAACYRNHLKPLDQALAYYQEPKGLPTPIYEALPFAYLLVSGLCYRYSSQVIYLDLMLMATALLAISGILIWIMRGYYRGYHSHKGDRSYPRTQTDREHQSIKEHNGYSEHHSPFYQHS